MAISSVEESNPWLAVTLRARVGESVDPARVADVLVTIMREVETALGPVIGVRGVALLYRRSLYLTPKLHSLLAITPDEARGLPTSLDFGALRSLLAQHSVADSIRDGSALLQTLYDLLVTLVGLPLTERLLRPVWANYSSGLPAPDGSS